MYSYAFACQTIYIRDKFGITEQLTARNFFAVCFIIGIECTLIAIILKTICFDVDHFQIYTPTVSVYITRFICTLLMHMELIEEVKQGMNMILYLNTH